MTPPTPTIELRDITRDDLPTLYENQADAEAAHTAAVPSRTRDDFHAHWEKLFADPDVRRRAILADGELAGFLILFNRGGHLQVGYWLGRDHWGRGIASRALELFLAEVAIRPLYAHVASRNPASLRVVEKCGFRRESVTRVEKDGDGYDDVVFVLD